jgi:hypothetical protein
MPAANIENLQKKPDETSENDEVLTRNGQNMDYPGAGIGIPLIAVGGIVIAKQESGREA